MATVVSVQIQLREPLSSEEARRLADETAPKYKQTPGLVRKYFVRGEDGLSWGGIYLWETRGHAEVLFDEEWQARVTDTYGSPPTMRWLDCALVLDNRHGEVVTD